MATKIAMDPNSLEDQLRQQATIEKSKEEEVLKAVETEKSESMEKAEVVENTVAEIVGESLDTVDLDHLVSSEKDSGEIPCGKF